MNSRPAPAYSRMLFFPLKTAADAVSPSKTLSSAKPAACIQLVQPASSLTFSSMVLGVYPWSWSQFSKPSTYGFAKCSRLSTLFQCLRFCFDMIAPFVCLEPQHAASYVLRIAGCRDKSACPQKIGAILDPVRISLSVPSVAFERGSRLSRGHGAAGPSRSLGCQMGALVHRRAVSCGDITVAVAALWSHHLLHAVQPCEHADLLMSDHAPGCGRFAPRPDPRNGLQQL